MLPRKRSKPKRDNLSEGGAMELEQESLDQILFFKDNNSCYEQPPFHHYSVHHSRKYSNFDREANEDHEVESDRIAYNVSCDVKSEVYTSQSRIVEKLSNKSERANKDIGGLGLPKGCKCTKVNCLKRTCGCFETGKFCGEGCFCEGCKNTEDNQSQISRAKVQAKLRSNRSIFDNIQHQIPTKVCTCPKSRCQKNYCECYQAGIPCNDFCKCIDCQNVGHKKFHHVSTHEKSTKG